MKRNTKYKLYWGDLHSHCSISYGEGKLKDAIKRASEQLDFCSITGHAFWPDINTLNSNYSEIKNYHTEGFKKLRKNWKEIINKLKLYEKKYSIKIFPSYEWHSLKFGDHNIYSKNFDLKLIDAIDIKSLKQQLSNNNLMIPHHIGYGKNKRGINWDYFSTEFSPFVEIYSMHGCSMDEKNPFSMLHDMGTLNGKGTAITGWKKNKLFGVIASSDHHGGYPGSFENGMMAVLARNKSKKELWESFLKRRVYAVTGDKINLSFKINNHEMGSVINNCSKRLIKIKVESFSSLSQIILYKNDNKYKIFNVISKKIIKKLIRGSLEISWGWGQKNKTYKWNGEINIAKGQIIDSQTCFRGIPTLAPTQNVPNKINKISLPHKLLLKNKSRIKFESITVGNYSLKDPGYQSLKLKIVAEKDSTINILVNKKKYKINIIDIIKNGSKVFYMNGWLNQLIKIGPFNFEDEISFNKNLVDTQSKLKNDRYRIEVIQDNGHYAWSSPIWTSVK